LEEADGYILLVESDPAAEAQARAELARVGCRSDVAVARDGEAALALLEGSPEPPQAILLALRLPGLGGLEVLRWIRARPETRLVPVLALSGTPDPREAAACFSLGANRYEGKPLELSGSAEGLSSPEEYWLLLGFPAAGAPAEGSPTAGRMRAAEGAPSPGAAGEPQAS
jgi:two-component system, response regulator